MPGASRSPRNKQLPISSIVFDFDGTLAELRLDFAEMKRRIGELAERYLPGRPQPGETPALEWIEILVRQIVLEDSGNADEFRRHCHDTILELEVEAARNGQLFPQTRSMLKDLKRQGIKLAIITRNCDQAVFAVFPDWRDHCDCLLTRDQVAAVKPNPDHLYQALEILQSEPDEALMVGDHPLDIETGRRAGTRTAGVASGNISVETLALKRPDWIASDCQDLISLLNSLAILTSNH